MKKIEKLNMAVEQLEDALKMYFEGRYHSATVLGGAAEQLLAGYVMKHAMTPVYCRDRTTITMIANGLEEHARIVSGRTTEKKIGDKLNFGYNHSKHAGKNDHTVPIDSKFEARQIIDRTLSNYDALSGIIEYDLPGLALAPSFYRELIKDGRFEVNK